MDTSISTRTCVAPSSLCSAPNISHQNPRQPGSSSSNTKCPLWDNLDERHDKEVKEAYRLALEKYKEEHPDVEVEKDLKVDLPKSPPKPKPGELPLGYIDPYALAAGAMPWVPPVMPPVPGHLNLAPARRDLRYTLDRLRRHRVALENHQKKLESINRREKELRAIYDERQQTGLSTKEIADLRKELSTTAVQRAVAEEHAAMARRGIAEVEMEVQIREADIAERERELEEWRAEQQQWIEAERRRHAELQAQVRMQQMQQQIMALRAGREGHGPVARQDAPAPNVNHIAMQEAVRRQRRRVEEPVQEGPARMPLRMRRAPQRGGRRK